MKIYLDVCCLNRPYDDQSQLRIRLESEAVVLILSAVEQRHHELITGEALDLENGNSPNDERRRRVRDTLRLAKHVVVVDAEAAARAMQLVSNGFGAYDALHIASAEAGGAAVLLTTDDGLIRKARSYRGLRVRVCNPLEWIREGNE